MSIKCLILIILDFREAARSISRLFYEAFVEEKEEGARRKEMAVWSFSLDRFCSGHGLSPVVVVTVNSSEQFSSLASDALV